MKSGSKGIDCSICGAARESGFAGYYHLGLTPSPPLLLGLEAAVWSRNRSSATVSASTLALLALWYPSRTGGLFLKAGTGVMTYRDNTVLDLSTVGGSVLLGAGYDIPVARRLSLTAFVQAIGTADAELRLHDVKIGENVTPNVAQFGLGLTWH